MKKLATIVFAVFALPFSAIAEPHPGGAIYLVLDRDLQRLKDDFNAARGSIRLLFVVGPTCGICLRGMADLSDEFLDDMQGDERLQTFIVHVPVLGATEDHVKPAMPLLQGPDIFHYWDETGISGQHYSNVLKVDAYAWDVWFAYGPDAEWVGELPPEPFFWQHQLSPFPRELYLDAELFAKKTMAMVNELAAVQTIAKGRIHSEKEGFEIAHVAQSPERAESNYVRVALGGRENIKSVESIEMIGTLITGGSKTPQTITMARPNRVERTTSALSPERQAKLDETFDFEGVLFNWRSKDVKLAMRGMVKVGEVLAWRIDMMMPSGDHWELLVDSHSGNTIRQRLLTDVVEDYSLEIIYSDFRETEGMIRAHKITYKDGDDHLLGTEIIEIVHVERDPNID